MNLINKLNEMSKKMDFLDITLTKWSVFFIALFLVKFFPELLLLEWYWYLIIGLLLAIRPLYHFWFNKNSF